MQVTEVRVKLVDEFESPNKRLLAFCSVVFDHAFVIRDLKLIDGNMGPFVSMPDRKLMDHCPECDQRNPLVASYCNRCGYYLGEWIPNTENPRLFSDVAHPITMECRRMISTACFSAYEHELEISRLSGYLSDYEFPVFPNSRHFIPCSGSLYHNGTQRI